MGHTSVKNCKDHGESDSAQRAAALRVIRAYRTVSDVASLLLARMPPADLVALERTRIRDRLSAAPDPGAVRPSKAAIKREERQATLTLWQTRWESSTKGEWTRRVIPNVRRWIERTVVVVPSTFHMTQALTNHGCFQQYLARMDRAPSAACNHCAGNSDTAEHTLFVCEHWTGHRAELESRLGHQSTAADLPEILCGPDFDVLPADPEERVILLAEADERLRLFYKMVESIMSLKEEEERARQALERGQLRR